MPDLTIPTTQVPRPCAWFWMPTRPEIEAIQVGALAPNCFGYLARVSEVFGRGTDINGNRYVCYKTELGAGSTITASLTEGQVVRHIGLSAAFTATEIWLAEKALRVAAGRWEARCPS